MGTQTAIQTPRGSSMRNTVTLDVLQDPPPAVALGNPTIKVYRISNPAEITVINNAKKLYVVMKGEAVGIYKTW